MKSILAAGSIALGMLVIALTPEQSPGALLMCLVLGSVVVVCISQLKTEREFLLQVFLAGLLVRMFVGTLIFYFELQSFFGGDAFSYDFLGDILARVWSGELSYSIFRQSLGVFLTRNWGMIYVVGGIYTILGKNMLAVQFFSAVLGAATAPVIFLCAQHIYGNLRVSRFSAYFIAFYPSIVLWSSQGLKDGPLVFLLALCMYSTLKLGERLTFKHLAILAGALFGIFTMRFYIFYMMLAAIGGSYIIGIGKMSAKSLVRNFVVLVALGLAMMYLGVLNSAGRQFEDYGNLEAVQRSRSDLAIRGESGFGKDVDVSTTSGALSAIPIGMLYLLFAPFPWQLASLRQSITFPEMVVWWVSFPVLVMGLWFTLKYRIRQALPILIFTTMLTLAYSVFQGNVGTAYRQRSQLLIFYFIFASVGYVLIRERREDARRQEAAILEAEQEAALQPFREALLRQMGLPTTTSEEVLVEENYATDLLRRRQLDPARARAYDELHSVLSAYFLSHPAATPADFDRCWPELRDEIFTRHASQMLATLPTPLHVILEERMRWREQTRGRGNIFALTSGGNGDGNGDGNGHH